jgi:hypothetical protein
MKDKYLPVINLDINIFTYLPVLNNRFRFLIYNHNSPKKKKINKLIKEPTKEFFISS